MLLYKGKATQGMFMLGVLALNVNERQQVLLFIEETEIAGIFLEAG